MFFQQQNQDLNTFNDSVRYFDTSKGTITNQIIKLDYVLVSINKTILQQMNNLQNEQSQSQQMELQQQRRLINHNNILSQLLQSYNIQSQMQNHSSNINHQCVKSQIYVNKQKHQKNQLFQKNIINPNQSSLNIIQSQKNQLQCNSQSIINQSSIQSSLISQPIQDYFAQPSPLAQSLNAYQKSDDILFLNKNQTNQQQLNNRDPLLTQYANSLTQSDLQQFQNINHLIQKQYLINEKFHHLEILNNIYKKVKNTKKLFLKLRIKRIQNLRLNSQQLKDQQSSLFMRVFEGRRRRIKQQKKILQKNQSSIKQYFKKFSTKQKSRYVGLYLKNPTEQNMKELTRKLFISQLTFKSWIRQSQIQQRREQLILQLRKLYQKKNQNSANSYEVQKRKITFSEFKQLSKQIIQSKFFGCNKIWCLSFIKANNLSDIIQLNDIQINKKSQLNHKQIYENWLSDDKRYFQIESSQKTKKKERKQTENKKKMKKKKEFDKQLL